MPLWLILGIALSVVGYGGFIWFMVVTTRENHKALERSRDPYEVRERRVKVTRALAREGIVSLGHTRVGIDRRHPC